MIVGSRVLDTLQTMVRLVLNRETLLKSKSTLKSFGTL